MVSHSGLLLTADRAQPLAAETVKLPTLSGEAGTVTLVGLKT
jgi:hypothetical protein